MPSSGLPKSTRVGLRGTSLFEFWKWARRGSYSLPPPGSYMRGLPRFGLGDRGLVPFVIECFTVGKVLTVDPPELPDELHRRWDWVRPPSNVYLERVDYCHQGTLLFLTALPTNWVIEEEEEWERVGGQHRDKVLDLVGRPTPRLGQLEAFFKSLGVRSYEERSSPVVL